MSVPAPIQQWTPAKKTTVSLLCGLVLVGILISLPSPPPENSSPPLRTNSITSPVFDSPEHALETLLAAYQSRDIEAIVAAKDFALDSQLFWEGLGLPTNEKQKTNSVAALETNFRKQLATGIPDYRGLKYSMIRQVQTQSNLVVIILSGELPDGQKLNLTLPTLLIGTQWKVVLMPGYDHL